MELGWRPAITRSLGRLCGERDQEPPALREPGAVPSLLYPPGEEVWAPCPPASHL